MAGPMHLMRFKGEKPNVCISLHWRFMCGGEAESAKHLFLPCPITLNLRWNMFREAGLSRCGVIP